MHDDDDDDDIYQFQRFSTFRGDFCCDIMGQGNKMKS